MKHALLFLLPLCALFLAGCAGTTLYEGGKPIAHFQGDMTASHYEKNGAHTTWNVGNVSHSTATLAGAQDIDAVTRALAVLAAAYAAHGAGPIIAPLTGATGAGLISATSRKATVQQPPPPAVLSRAR